jgi:hypothetical protein
MLDYFDWSSPGGIQESLRRYMMFRRVGGHTLVSRIKLNTLCTLVDALEAAGVSGAIVECGVYRGGAAALMSHQSGGRRDVVLFDSFEGLPRPGERDGATAAANYREGWCLGSEEDVRDIFRRLGVHTDRVQIVKGWFQQTFPVTDVPPIAMLHIDADWYDSVKICLETHFDHVVPGGYIVLDDYGRWEGCTHATDEFLAARGLGPLIPTGPVGHYLQKGR